RIEHRLAKGQAVLGAVRDEHLLEYPVEGPWGSAEGLRIETRRIGCIHNVVMNEVALIAHDLREPFQSRLSFDETIDAGRVLLHKLGEILCAAVRVCLFHEQS